MKVWEILKAENDGKEYLCEGKVYQVKRVVGADGVYLYKDGRDVLLGEWVLNKEFRECSVVNQSGWIEDIDVHDGYYVVGEEGVVDSYFYSGDSLDAEFMKTLNMFSTAEKAEEIAKEQLLYRMIKRFRDVNETEKVTWDSILLGYFIALDTLTQKYIIRSCTMYKQPNTIYFSNLKLAERCLEEVVLPFLKDNDLNF